MKKNNLILGIFLVITAILFSGCGESVSVVTIGSQVWTSKNLDVDSFRNGDPIPYAKTAKEWEIALLYELPAYCNYDNNPANGEKYGKLYNWYALNDQRGLAPNGYHIPSDEEWMQLIDYLGGKGIAGTKIKSTSGWNYVNGTDSSGFSGLPGGGRDFDGEYFQIGKAGYWWSSTRHDSDSRLALFCNLSGLDVNVDRGVFPKGAGFSVRCLRD